MNLPGIRYPRCVDRPRLAIIGCGDVAYRHYLPAFAELAGEVQVTAFVDPRDAAAQRAADAVADWSPGARAFTDLEAMLEAGVADAAIDLTPAPRHGAVNRPVSTRASTSSRRSRSRARSRTRTD